MMNIWFDFITFTVDMHWGELEVYTRLQMALDKDDGGI